MRPLVLACFFLSGASGLILEMVWTRGLTLVFGSTTLAISTVLATFMGGLGLGSFVAGRFADRLRDPVRAYAWAELGIGVYALLVPLALSAYPPLNRWLWAAFGDRYALLSLIRFAASAGLLLLPTTLMGATLPILARFLVASPGELGRVGGNLGTLYAVNLFGAVAGSFFAGFVFLPQFGVRTTNAIAAGFDIALAVTVLALRARLARGRAPAPSLEVATTALPDKAAAPPVRVSKAALRLVLFGFLLSGFSAMLLQVLWTRALAVVLGSSVFSFTLILIAFLVGLGGGSAAFGRLADRDARPIFTLGCLHLGIVAAVGFSYLITDELPFVFAWLVASTEAGVDAIQVCQFAAACVSVLPATFLMGGIFPYTMRVVAVRWERVGRDLGSAYALNTIGAILGSFFSGFVVLPGLGLEKGILGAAFLGLGLGCLLFLVAPGQPPARRALGLGTAVALGLGLTLLPPWNLINFSVGFFRVSIAKDYIARRDDKKVWQKPELVFYEDGISTTVSVDRWGKTYSMKNNGKVDASSDADMPTQISVGLLPLLLYPHDTATRPPKVALIGYGSGVTAGAITQFPIASLEVVELEPAIYRAARFFDAVNHRPLENPKVTARVGDGRNFLTQRQDRFDVIVSQPSNPWITGVSNLFTREYFRDVKARLAPDGIFCQWAQLYEMAPWNIKTIYRTLRASFAYVVVFAAEDLSSDTILIASDRPIAIDLAQLRRRFDHPRTRAEAERAGLSSPHDIPATLLLGPHEIDAFVAGAPLNTDDNARIEFAAPRDLLGFARYDRYLARVYGPRWPYGRLEGLVAGYDGPQGAADRARLAQRLLAHGKLREAHHWLRLAEAAGGGPDAEHVRALLALTEPRDERDPEVPLAGEAPLSPLEIPGSFAPALQERLLREHREVLAHLDARRFATAYKILEGWPAEVFGHLGKDFSLLSGFLHYKAELHRDAVDELSPVAHDEAFAARRPQVHYYLGRAQLALARYDKAMAAFEAFLAATSTTTMKAIQ